MFSRNKTADTTSGTSKNGLGLQQLQGKNQSTNSDDQRDSSNSAGGRRSKGFLNFGISKGSKQNKTSNTTQSGFHLKTAMRQEQSRHRGSNAGNVSPDITEESSFYSGGSEGSWDTEASFEAGNDCGFFGGFEEDDDDTDDEREETSKEGSLAKTPVEDRNGCGALVTDGLGDLNNETAVDQMTVASAAPIGMPSVSALSAWLFAADYDNSQSGQKNEEVDKVDRTAELNKHQGQLDIYARTPGSLRLRLYPNAPRRPDRSDHVLVKVEVSRNWCLVDALYFTLFSQ